MLACVRSSAENVNDNHQDCCLVSLTIAVFCLTGFGKPMLGFCWFWYFDSDGVHLCLYQDLMSIVDI